MDQSHGLNYKIEDSIRKYQMSPSNSYMVTFFMDKFEKKFIEKGSAGSHLTKQESLDVVNEVLSDWKLDTAELSSRVLEKIEAFDILNKSEIAEIKKTEM